MIYALDTNTISYILRNEGGIKERWLSEERSGNHIVIPLIVYYEVQRGLLSNGAITKMKAFIALCDVIGVNDLTVTEINTASSIYATLKQQGKLIDDADILIASQCMVNGYTLVTNNTKHFERIEGLRFVNWVA